jgi:hypothetical protein
MKELAETIPSKGPDNYRCFSCLSDESLDNSESFSLSSLDFLPEEHIIIPVSLKDMSNQYVPTFALIDSGATSNFVNESFVFDKSFPLKLLPIPRVLKVVDGRTISSGKVTHSVSSEFSIGNKHKERITLNVASIGQFPIILGLPWLKLHSPQIDWKAHKISFSSSLCLSKCLTNPSDMSVESVPETALFVSSNVSSSLPPLESCNNDSSSQYSSCPDPISRTSTSDSLSESLLESTSSQVSRISFVNASALQILSKSH